MPIYWSRLFFHSKVLSVPTLPGLLAVNARMMASLRDPNTLSNYDKFLTSHITAKLDIDFEKNQLTGNVILKLKSLGDDGTKVIKLDSRYVDSRSSTSNHRIAPSYSFKHRRG